jgi:hypothetical protein
MTRWPKVLTGLAATLIAGWIVHAPLGQGAAFLDGVQARAQAAVRAAGVTTVEVRMGHDPLSRVALLSGEANDFQRNGMGLLPGINGRVAEVAGVGAVRWTDRAEGRGFALPLLVETEALAVLLYAIGIGIGWIIFRPRREGFL